MKGVFIFLADGFEDMEALGTLDVLRRGGVDVRTVAVGDFPMVTSSHGVDVTADMTLDSLPEGDSASREDIMIFPGGMPGSRNLAECAPLMKRMKAHFASGGTVAAICAAPGLVASELPLEPGFRFTCFPGFEESLLALGGIYTEGSTEVSGRLVTGRGAGHAVAFGLTLLDYLAGPSVAAKVRSGLML